MTGTLRSRVARGAFLALMALAIFYVACGIVIALIYRAVLYPAPVGGEPIAADAKFVAAPTVDGKTARALIVGSADARATILFFHGNGEFASDGIVLARTLSAHGIRMVLVEYRGYGFSRDEGSPNELGLYADAEAIIQSVGDNNFIVMGYSLGTGVAVEMAARGHGRALMLFAPFTSIPDVARRIAPVFPMKLLIRDSFDSKSKAHGITMPVLIEHGESDELISFDMGKTLAIAFPHARLVPIAGAHHGDLFVRDDQLVSQIVNFVREVNK